MFNLDKFIANSVTSQLVIMTGSYPLSTIK